MTRIFVPLDSCSVAVGAETVVAALIALAAREGVSVEVVRTGSRGMHWLEPLVEVEVAGERVGYGPIVPGDVDIALLKGSEHPKMLGVVNQLPWMKRQTRITFERCGLIDPLSIDDFVKHGGLTGFRRAREIGRQAIIECVTKSQLRGRGGAGFPAGVKWQTVSAASGNRKFVVCNADEGDSGTFADRMIMEGDPFSLIEGMMIAAFAVGASKGYVYSRSEYPNANRIFALALDLARKAAWIGDDFDIELRIGAGAYVCGEETALLESLEGKRGQVRAKPPLPAHAGLFGAPTLVNNVLTLATVPWIVRHGGDAYAAHGFGRSRGTMPVQLAGNVKRGGLFEVPFGMTLGALVDDIGGGSATGRPVRAVQCGGPLGAYFPRSMFDTIFDYESFAAKDGLIGHGGIVVFDDSVDMAEQARFALEFCAKESCGKCTPCRVGSVRGTEVIDRILDGTQREMNVKLLLDLCQTLKLGSLCALGGFTPYPVLSAFQHFPEDFAQRTVSVRERASR